jgi:hypothetical protein
MADYKITFDEEDFYTSEKVQSVTLKGVVPKLTGKDIEFIDMITGEVVRSWPKRRILHFVDLREEVTFLSNRELSLDT